VLFEGLLNGAVFLSSEFLQLRRPFRCSARARNSSGGRRRLSTCFARTSWNIIDNSILLLRFIDEYVSGRSAAQYRSRRTRQGVAGLNAGCVRKDIQMPAPKAAAATSAIKKDNIAEGAFLST